MSPLSEPSSPSLLQLLDSPRISFVDLSYLDNDTGTSLLHEVARRKDLCLVELAVRAGTCLSGRLRMRRLERTIVSACSYNNVRSITLVATHTDESPVTNQDKKHRMGETGGDRR